MANDSFDDKVLHALAILGKPRQKAEIADELIAQGYKVPAGLEEEAWRKRVERALKRLWKKSRFHPEFDSANNDRRVRRSGDGQETRYEFVGNYKDYDQQDVEDINELGLVLASLIMEDYCKFAIPPQLGDKFRDYLTSSLSEFGNATDSRDTFSISPRGQQLRYDDDDFLYDTMHEVYEALHNQKQLKFDYVKVHKGKEVSDSVAVSPIGIRFADPKFYLIAQATDGKPKPYIIQNMRNVLAMDEDSVNDLITFEEYENSQIPLGPPGFGGTPVEVVLEIHEQGNLIRDILTFKLDSKQKEELKADGTLILTLDKFYISHEFVAWIMGRMEQVRVVKPENLANFIKQKATSIRDLY